MSPQDEALTSALAERLVAGALPAELQDFGPAEQADAVAFLLAAARERAPGTPRITLEPIASDDVRRRLRMAVINDDMPFLVDSVAAAVSARGIAIDRILHPVIPVRRDAGGALQAIGPDTSNAGVTPESMIYLELERVDARDRRALGQELDAALADVRAAVNDWPAMRAALARDAELCTGEGAELLRWFSSGKLTLLGHARWTAAGGMTDALGLARQAHAVPLIDDGALGEAAAWLVGGGNGPLLLKSNLISTVHRAAPLDLIVLPRTDGGLSIHAGLWTSAALSAPAPSVPILRERLSALQAKFGFDPRGHTGKALAHALGALPHDLSVAFEPAVLEELALTAMSLADRPRPRLVLAPSPLRRHLYAFAWLPRDELTTARRAAIGEMLTEAAGAELLTWSIQLDDVTALIRYTLDIPDGATAPDAAELDGRLTRMIRGWATEVEAALADVAPQRTAARLALKWANAFPNGYRTVRSGAEAAADILRLDTLSGSTARSVRIATEGTRTRLKIYRRGGALSLSDAVPVLENFGFRVVEELPTPLGDEGRSHLHDFHVETGSVIADAPVLEAAIAAALEGRAENDPFDRLILEAGVAPAAVVLMRAWFRYLRQAGLPYGLATVVDALRRAPAVAAALVDRFAAAHDPAASGDVAEADERVARGLDAVSAIDDDRILRAYRDLVAACLRTNAFAPAAAEALAFKLDSAAIPGLPAPLPWREIWVYSPRVEGIHLRAGPIARGGLRWSDRRDDFRTEVLGLMKAQRVKNAVIVPTGAKGGFYPKQLPPLSNRDAWLAEGTESYRILIRALLSITDNIVGEAVVHPEGVRVHDGEDPYFVVAADKGTATFSDVANAIALERGFWLGDAFASGGSQGYDHKAMGITAKGAWISVERHFAERGVDVQADPVTVIGCGDMSGDVFGNGLLLSKSVRLLAAFDHRHIFIDPTPDAARSWDERERLFALPRSSWADYDPALLSPGGGVYARTDKVIHLSHEARAALGLIDADWEPTALISAILRAPADLLWFGGIGTYVKASAENNAAVGDPANDRLRVDAETLRVTAIGEGANLGLTQAARIAFAARGGRINTDFIDNSAGVDCSDNEVNIKIALNREMTEGRLSFEDRNVLLASMTDDVSRIVLEDNRLQTLALSIAEAASTGGGAAATPSYVRAIEIFEGSGRLDRAVEGLASNEELLRRGQAGQGLTRPELAVLLATAKLALQDAIEAGGLGFDDALVPDLHAAFPPAMRERFGAAIDAHRLRAEIVATKLANRIVNRLGLLHPFELAEEEGAATADIAGMFVVAEQLFGLPELWAEIEATPMAESGRLALFDEVAAATRSHIADLLRIIVPGAGAADILAHLEKGVRHLDAETTRLLLDEARIQSGRIRADLETAGAPPALASKVVRLFELDGAIGLAELGARLGLDEVVLARAFTHLGQALGLDWAQATAARIVSSDPWERLLIAGLARDFQQIRLEFLARCTEDDPGASVDGWLRRNAARVAQFKAVVDRARLSAKPHAAMLAQIAGQARVLLGR
ncbi:NAD-glutamate dehydrogenase domain-containing protein [uncultured Sphingomonas sp.]|uniref:NAD-glutamate dehydrogenase domain-containing protein n=1 Tax=uncultured Sphingomonas sp. TaxID=158754 RepID=UPI0035CA3132